MHANRSQHHWKILSIGPEKYDTVKCVFHILEREPHSVRLSSRLRKLSIAKAIMATKMRKSTDINPYEVLGLAVGATSSEIDKGFKK